MKLAAAIRRASKKAQAAMFDLDATAAAELLENYKQAAAEVKARIAAAVDAANMVPVYKLRDLLARIEDVIDNWATRRDQLVTSAIEQAATLGIQPFTPEGVLAVGGTEAPMTSSQASVVHRRAVEFVTTLVQTDGLTLSDRIWKLNRGAKEALTRQIGLAVVQGQSATTAAQQLVMGGSAIPPDVAGRVARGRLPALVSAVDMLVNPNGGDGYWQAERVMRTEINRAHGEAFMAAGEGTPGFAGWRYLLSPRHPRPDICDLLSTQNLHGLGKGVYPSRELTPWPAHPNTLSFLEIVFEDEITDADRAGKETALQALQRLAPEVRDGVLGVNKAKYFDKGLLRTGMIRSPLHSVEQRLARQGWNRDQSPPPAPPVVNHEALPQYDKAVIPTRKIEGYALNPEHESGRNKARVFQSVLGINQTNSDLLVEEIRRQLPLSRAVEGDASNHGRRFVVDMLIAGPGGTGTVRTAWLIEEHGGAPRLSSAYVVKKRKNNAKNS